jgi:addiction module RelB/DinJ family antitoxin
MEEALKKNFEYVCEELGMNMSTAINVFAKKVCREHRIPFEVSIDRNYQNIGGEKTMKKTKFRVKVWPEMLTLQFESKEKIFEDFEEAFFYLKSECDQMIGEIMECGDMEISSSTVFFAIEFINPENMHNHAIVFDDFGERYEHDGVIEDLSFDCEEDIYDAVYGFVKALGMIGKISL